MGLPTDTSDLPPVPDTDTPPPTPPGCLLPDGAPAPMESRTDRHAPTTAPTTAGSGPAVAATGGAVGAAATAGATDASVPTGPGATVPTGPGCTVSGGLGCTVSGGPGCVGVRAPEIGYRPARKPGAVRRGPADPVKSLMHRHRELCERAIDPLEIAAGLEAHGLTDRTAARYRHRDVFSLAEELYARMPAAARARPGAACPPQPVRDTEPRARWALFTLLPGAACLATAGVLRATEGVLGGGARFAVTAVGALLVTLALRFCLRSGPLRAPDSAGAVTLYGCWLLGYAVYGEDLLAQVISGGPDGHWAAAPAPLLGLALAVAPAAWCAHLFSAGAQRKLTGSRALEEFGAGVRPLLLGVVTLFLCALVPLLLVAGLGYGDGTSTGAVALGVLLFLARLLMIHGFPEPAAIGLAAACAVEVAAPFTVLAGRLPGLDLLARPVDAAVTAAGTGAVPAIACGAAALGLLLHAAVALSRASAHATV